MREIIAIDPGPERSAIVRLNPASGKIEAAIIAGNDVIVGWLDQYPRDIDMVIEMVAGYGMSVGKEVFETCVWIGRFIEAAKRTVHRITRIKIKQAICHNTTAKDKNIRQALIDRWSPTGGGKCGQIGTKKKPGPLFGIHDDLWAALAVAVAWSDLNGGGEEQP